jgi:hypothetical protein
MTTTLGILAALSLTAGIGIAGLGCGSGTVEGNPCATPGATYLFHFVERRGGTCGPAAEATDRAEADGTLSSSAVCDDVEHDACTERDTGCRTSNHGADCTFTTDVTFTKDGSGASGLQTATCSNALVCTSTYDVTVTRR